MNGTRRLPRRFAPRNDRFRTAQHYNKVYLPAKTTNRLRFWALPIGCVLFVHHFFVLPLQQLPQGIEHHQCNEEIADAVGNIEGNAGDPLGHRIGKATDEDIHNTAEGTEKQAENTRHHSPSQRMLHIS